jgi:hypothetical protein
VEPADHTSQLVAPVVLAAAVTAALLTSLELMVPLTRVVVVAALVEILAVQMEMADPAL